MSNFRLPQKVTYWTPKKADANGTITYDAGIAISGRWMKKDGTVTTEDGRNQRTTHLVYAKTLIPKRALIALEDLDKVAAPPDDAREVIENFNNPSMTDMFKMVL